jgi:hypothetical protein
MELFFWRISGECQFSFPFTIAIVFILHVKAGAKEEVIGDVEVEMDWSSTSHLMSK